MSITTGIRDVFREGNLSKVIELLARGFNMNIQYIGGESTYQVDPRNRQYTEVQYMETPPFTAVSSGRQNCVNLQGQM